MPFFSKSWWVKVKGGTFVDASGATVVVHQNSTGSREFRLYDNWIMETKPFDCDRGRRFRLS
jgi:hypothetical protein